MVDLYSQDEGSLSFFPRGSYESITAPTLFLMACVHVAVFQLFIGSISGMIGGVQGLLILALVLLLEKRMCRVEMSSWGVVVIQAVLFTLGGG